MKRTLLFIVGLAGSGALTLTYAMFQGGFVSWFLFFATFLLIAYEVGTWLWGSSQLECERILSANRLTAGQSLQVELVLRNRSKWPIFWASLEDVLRSWSALHRGGTRTLLYPGFRKETRVQYSILHMPRGRFEFPKTIVQTGDLFGFVQQSKMYPSDDHVMVYPKIIPITVWNTANQYRSGATQAQNRITEESGNVFGVRDYTQGDRLSRIHWRASARTGALKSKEFELHFANDLMFFLDRSVYDYPFSKVAFELAVTTVVSLIHYSIQKKHAAGLISFGKERKMYPLSHRPEQFAKILDHLAVVLPDSDALFHDTVLREAQSLPRGSTIVLVTPLIRDETVRLFGLLTHRNIQVELFLIHPELVIPEELNQKLARSAAFGTVVHVIRKEKDLPESLKGGGRYGQSLGNG